MPFTAQQVIDDARLRSAAFDEVTIPPPVALALLDGYVRRLRAEVFQRFPHALASQTTISLPLSDFELGAVMPPYLAVLDITAFLNVMGVERGEQVTLVPFEQRFDSGVWPAAYLVRDGLYLKGDPSEWIGYTALLVTFVPSDSRIPNLGVQIDLPDACEMACVENLAALMAVRQPALVGPDAMGALLATAQTSQELALRNLTAQRRTERWNTREY